MWVLGTEPRSSGREAGVPLPLSFLSHLIIPFLKPHICVDNDQYKQMQKQQRLLCLLLGQIAISIEDKQNSATFTIHFV